MTWAVNEFCSGKLLRNKILYYFNNYFSNTFYKQINEPNVHLDGSKLLEITENGIRTEDSEFNVDIIIYATGFQLKENFAFIYDNNPEMKSYAEGHNNAAYYGLMHPFAPNFATFLGPMTGLGHK